MTRERKRATAIKTSRAESEYSAFPRGRLTLGVFEFTRSTSLRKIVSWHSEFFNTRLETCSWSFRPKLSFYYLTKKKDPNVTSYSQAFTRMSALKRASPNCLATSRGPEVAEEEPRRASSGLRIRIATIRSREERDDAAPRGLPSSPTRSSWS